MALLVVFYKNNHTIINMGEAGSERESVNLSVYRDFRQLIYKISNEHIKIEENPKILTKNFFAAI